MTVRGGRQAGHVLVALVMGAFGMVLPAGGQVIPPDTAEAEAPVVEEEIAEEPLEVVADEAVEERLQAVFGYVDDFEDIQVDVNEGVVRLQGTALRAEARQKAEELAAGLDGVVYVDNDIAYVRDVETRVAPALEKLQDYVNRTVATLPVLGVALLVVLLFGLLGQLVGRWDAPYRRLGIQPLVRGLIRQALRTLIVGAGLLLALDILDVAALVGAVLGTAGVVGLALGFAFQDIVENYLAGVLLSIRRPFGLGDLVQIEDHEEGKVVRLTSRELVLMTLEGNHLRLPNATVFKSRLVNYSRNPRRLFHFDVGIGVDQDLTYAMRLGTETLQAMNGVMGDPASFARIQELGDSSVIVRFHGWVDQREADFLKVRSEAIRLVKAALDAAEIDVPDPIFQVRLRSGPDGTPKETRDPQRPSTAAVKNEAGAVDVSVDTVLDAQIREDLAASDEDNLLLTRGEDPAAHRGEKQEERGLKGR